jgi:cysteine desulfurase
MIKKEKSPLYYDNAATTKVDARILEEMLPYFTEWYGNASSQHEFGQIAKRAIDKSRSKVANMLNCFENEIIYTSGATEAINLAIKGYVEANIEKGNHIITVRTEHKAVLNTCEYLETKGIEATYLNVDSNGLINLHDLENAIKENTILISVMYVNNETGVIQPIEKIGEIARKNDIAFFCDATQAVGKLKIDFQNSHIDMLCFSGHKMNGPKGTGALIRKNNIQLTPLIHGGGQEQGLRGGTYNTPLIVGLGKACELAYNEFEQNEEYLNNLRDKLQEYFEDNNIGKINFKDVGCAPHILSVTLKDFEADEYLMMKSNEFLASTGSACNAEVIEQSHVLRSIGIHENKVLRISMVRPNK